MDSYRIINSFCKKIYLVGCGNFWFENESIGDDSGVLYKIYEVFLCIVYGGTTLLEIMAALIGEFPDDEKSDAVTFAVCHTVVMVKLFTVISNKHRIRALNRKMVTICEEYQEEKFREANYKTIRLNIIAYISTVYGCMACYIYIGITKMFQVQNSYHAASLVRQVEKVMENYLTKLKPKYNLIASFGSHFVTAVTYYPAFEDDSLLAQFLRVLFTIILFFMLLTMIITVDAFSVTSVIMFKYKFITLRYYFDGLKEEFDKVCKTDVELAVKKLTNGIVKGIVLHGELKNMANEIDQIFGFVMALQVCQTFGSCVSVLLQIALLDEWNFVASMKAIFFVFALFFLLGLFLCNAGEITYQASLVSNSIFYCGWYECPMQRPPQRAIRTLVLFATMQAQQPIVMMGFKMLPLTYGTFISVVKSTYSVFALFYAQNQ